MKTIKEAANEYAKKTVANVVNNTSKGALRNYAIKDFIAGVEFAQKWISIDEELPPKNMNVLLKRNKPFHIYECTGFQRNGVFYSNTELPLNGEVIAWRPIHLKQF